MIIFYESFTNTKIVGISKKLRCIHGETQLTNVDATTEDHNEKTPLQGEPKDK